MLKRCANTLFSRALATNCDLFSFSSFLELPLNIYECINTSFFVLYICTRKRPVYVSFLTCWTETLLFPVSSANFYPTWSTRNVNTFFKLFFSVTNFQEIFLCLGLPNHTKPYQTIPYHTKPYQTIPNHTKPY